MPRMAALSGRHNGLVEVLIRRAKKRLKRQRRCMYLSDGVAVKKLKYWISPNPVNLNGLGPWLPPAPSKAR